MRFLISFSSLSKEDLEYHCLELNELVTVVLLQLWRSVVSFRTTITRSTTSSSLRLQSILRTPVPSHSLKLWSWNSSLKWDSVERQMIILLSYLFVTKHLANKIYLQRRNFYMVSFKNSFKRMCLLWHTQTPQINSKSIENTASIPVWLATTSSMLH